MRGLLDSANPDSVTLGSLSFLRRLMFDAQTLSVAAVKSLVDGTDPHGKTELVPAERQARIKNQKERLRGRSHWLV